MSHVLKFRREAEGNPGRNLQAWVTGYIGDPIGLGQESIIYTGCSKKICPSGFMPWFCRKRVGADRMAFPDEVNNHFHAHGGDCSPIEAGIPCFGMTVTVSDDSGSLKAEVWAPSMHLLGMKPSQWVGLDKENRSRLLKLASKRPFKMLLMTISHMGVHSHFKFHFVKPAAYHPMTSGLAELSTKFESIGVVEEDDEQSICTVGVQFAPPSRTMPIAQKLREAIDLISESYAKNAKAVSLLHEIMLELPSSSDS